ncbi:MAG: type I-B CRISPR-associated protein Cas5 [Ignavibacteriaceae bacterium]|nr:type I-B CRISPR-associated protein Cas5 [Ignavibacteriaceae bacterium]
MRLLIFDVKGEFGHFKKFNSTSSPMTYVIPTPTALRGMLGALIGLGREQCISEITKENSTFAIQVVGKIKKQGYSTNLINTKEHFYRIKTRTQVRYELLVNPHYRIYAKLNSGLFELVKDVLEKEKFKFFPYLGLANMTAKIDRVEEGVLINKKSNGQYVEVHTAINLNNYGNISFEQVENQRLSTAILPLSIELDNSDKLTGGSKAENDLPKNRITKEYGEILVETNGNPIKVLIEEYYEVPGFGNIVFI